MQRDLGPAERIQERYASKRAGTVKLLGARGVDPIEIDSAKATIVGAAPDVLLGQSLQLPYMQSATMRPGSAGATPASTRNRYQNQLSLEDAGMFQFGEATSPNSRDPGKKRTRNMSNMSGRSHH